MAYTTINKSTEHFNTKLWTGNSDTTRNITGVGFQPDWSWVKNRSLASDHRVHDAVRGANKGLVPNGNDAEDSSTTAVKSFLSDGIQIGNEQSFNRNGDNHVGWFWKANGAGSANTDGTITSTVSANTTAGISVVTWNGNSGTVGHGLGQKPDFIMVKSRDTGGSNNWVVSASGLGSNMNDNYLVLNSSAAQGSGSNTWGGEPTSTTFTVSSGVAANDNNIAYCFAHKKGFSTSGQYKGNGNLDGPFIYTGFKPSFVIIKSTTRSSSWDISDNKRIGYNPKNYRLTPHNNAAEYTGSEIYKDYLSNGFKIRATDTDTNSGSDWYWWFAFGQSLVGSNNVPCTAR